MIMYASHQRRRSSCTAVCCAFVAVCSITLVEGCTYNAKELQAFLRQPREQIGESTYRVYPPDVLQVSSVNIKEITNVVQQIRPDGRINLPLVGELDVSGKTPKEIEAQIMELASRFYSKVDATINVTGYRSQRFYVLGQVGRPGPMAWTGRDTLLDALATAQPTQLAWPERIILVRGTQPQMGGDSEAEESEKFTWTGMEEDLEKRGSQRMTFNLQAMVRHGDLSRNVFLQPNDIIYVQPNPLAKLGLAIQNLLFPVRPALEAARAPAEAATMTVMP